MGIVIDLKDMRVRTPEQVIRVFYRMYPAGTIEPLLWKVFAELNDNAREKEEELIPPEEIAVFFDQLLALANAIDVLCTEPPLCCPVCKREAEAQS